MLDTSQVMPTLGFIGGGNMATSLIGGLLAQYAKLSIWVSDPDVQKLQQLKSLHVFTTQHNTEVAKRASILILAIKPQAMKTVVTELKAAINPDTLVISIAAGITLSSLTQWLGNKIPIIRCMPNTPALVRCGATALCANTQVTAEQKQQATQILNAVGTTAWVATETDLDAVTAVSGSGPAYFFLVMEAMETAATELGLDKNIARNLILQTALGAAQMATQSNVSPAELRRRVTSPKGTTEAALNIFAQANFSELFIKAIAAAHARSISLAKEFGG